MIELLAFGSLDVRDAAARPIRPVLAQPKRAVLLAYLTLARPRGFHRRDELLALFWPDLDESRARNSLSRALTFLRRALPDGVLVTRGVEEVGVHPSVRSDVADFERGIEELDPARALDLYRGPFLAAMHVASAPTVGDWIYLERIRLQEAAAGAAWTLAGMLIEAGRFTDAERVGQRALTLGPTDESAVREFLSALSRGDRAASVAFYERFARVLGEELDLSPSPETQAVVESIRTRSGPVPAPDFGERGTRVVARPPPRQPEVAPAPGDRPARRWRGWLAMVVTVALVGTAIWATGQARSAGSRGDEVRRIAVLPFESWGLPASDSALPQGLTMELIRQLSSLPDLQVADWLAVRSLAPSRDAVMEAGRRLHVDGVLIGTLRGVEGHLRADVRLVDPASGMVLWSVPPVDRPREAVAGLQTTLALATARRLKVRMTAEAHAVLAATPTADTAAYRLYLLGRRHVDHLTASGVRSAIAELHEATERDSTFALAYAWLGLAHLFSIQLAQRPGIDVWPEVVRNANRALAIDSALAEAYVLIGFARHAWDWDWEAADASFRRAVELNPNDFHARVWYGQFLNNEGRHAEALEQAHRAQRLNPTDPYAAVNLGARYRYARRWEEAGHWADVALDLDPNYWVAYWLKGWVAIDRGSPAEAIAPLRKAISLCGDEFCVGGDLARAFARSGQADSAQARIVLALDRHRREHVSPELLAQLYLANGMTQSFCDALERAWQERDLFLPYLIGGDWQFLGGDVDDACVRRFARRVKIEAWFRPATAGGTR